MQLDFSDKRVLAAAITAGIVIVAVIGVESFLLAMRPSAYQTPMQQAGQQQETPCVRRGGVLIDGICKPVPSSSTRLTPQERLTEDELDQLDRLSKKMR